MNLRDIQIGMKNTFFKISSINCLQLHHFLTGVCSIYSYSVIIFCIICIIIYIHWKSSIDINNPLLEYNPTQHSDVPMKSGGNHTWDVRTSGGNPMFSGWHPEKVLRSTKWHNFLGPGDVIFGTFWAALRTFAGLLQDVHGMNRTFSGL